MNTPSASPTPPNEPNDAPWILVVDDEPSMRVLMEMILSTQGWKCLIADGADAAFEALRSRQTPPALVICDVLMPGVDGLNFARRLHARIPGIGIIFVSGSMSDMSSWPEDLRELRFLEKPFEAEQMISAVREALSAANKGR